MNPYFSEMKNNFGFGCMRLPMKGDDVDYEQTCKMFDTFLANGFNYFDTAHGYIGGKSEIALQKCLTSRYPRDKYVLTNKLSSSYFKKQEDIRPFFEEQLKICGVEYFDFYLMHAQSLGNYPQYKECKAYETALELKKEGKIKHLGISFHDKAAVLEKILTENPGVEIVQVQFNYLDYEDPAIQSRKCYEVCRKFGKPMIVMEPVKGGSLVNLPDEAKAALDSLGNGGSYASYAMRFAAGFDGVAMVISGMSDMAQTEDNIKTMKNYKPLTKEEFEAIDKVRDVFDSKHLIPCTACRYCVEGCPKKILIPDLFACRNAKKTFNDWNAGYYYSSVYTVDNGKASDCIKCGKCENICPQHLSIREYLDEVASEFDR